MSLDAIYANIAAARLELSEIRDPPMQVRDAIKRLSDAISLAQGMPSEGPRREGGSGALSTGKPGPKDAPNASPSPAAGR